MLKLSAAVLLMLSSLSCAGESVAAAASASGRVCPTADDPIESFSFKLSKVTFGPTSNQQVFAVALSYRYQPGITMPQFPDDNALAKLVRDFMANYPTPDDFVEQVNRGLNASILDATPEIVELTSAITKPNDGVITEPVTSVLTTAPSPCRPSGITRSP